MLSEDTWRYLNRSHGDIKDDPLPRAALGRSMAQALSSRGPCSLNLAWKVQAAEFRAWDCLEACLRRKALEQR